MLTTLFLGTDFSKMLRVPEENRKLFDLLFWSFEYQ